MQATANKQGQRSSLGVVNDKHGDGLRHSQGHQAVESQQGPENGEEVQQCIRVSMPVCGWVVAIRRDS